MSAAKISVDVAGILKRLGVDSINAGAWMGNLGWSKDTAGSAITSTNPATGETLAQVRSATVTDYENVMRCAVEAVQQELEPEDLRRRDQVAAGLLAAPRRRARRCRFLRRCCRIL